MDPNLLYYPGGWPHFINDPDPAVPESNPENMAATFDEFLAVLQPRTVYTDFATVALLSATIAPIPGQTFVGITSSDQTLWASINGAAYVALAKAGGTPWSTWSPSWFSVDGTNPEVALALGSGTLTGRYEIIGKDLNASFTLTRASGTNMGIGRYQWSLPAGVTFKNYATVSGSGAGLIVGKPVACTAYGVNSTRIGMLVCADSSRLASTTQVSGPNGWSDGDTINLQFSGEIN